jgi:hypothetical protein
MLYSFMLCYVKCHVLDCLACFRDELVKPYACLYVLLWLLHIVTICFRICVWCMIFCAYVDHVLIILLISDKIWKFWKRSPCLRQCPLQVEATLHGIWLIPRFLLQNFMIANVFHIFLF